MEMELHDDVALLRMNTGKANAINGPMLARLDQALDEFDAGPARALVLTGYERFFCAGLDLPTLYELDRDGVREVMGALHRVFGRVFACPAPVVAAVNGHAIAGGCALLQQTDHRVAGAGSFKVGLTETALAVGLPTVVMEATRYHVPRKHLHEVALFGGLFGLEDALERRLVDEIVPGDELLERALDRAQAFARMGPAYGQAKLALREPYLARIERSGDAEAEQWLDTWFSPEARAKVGAAIEALAAKR